MDSNEQVLTPTIIKYCKRVSSAEAKMVVSYCLYMAFRDKSVRRLEVDTAREVAQHVCFPPDELSRLARKARKRRLKIKEPETDDGRRLLFHLALRMAAVDKHVDARERSAIDKLATQLRVNPSFVESELNKLQADTAAPKTLRDTEPAESISDLADSLVDDIVIRDLEADLFAVARDSKERSDRRVGEVEYSVNRNGEAELSVEIESIDVPPDSQVDVFVNGIAVIKVAITSDRLDEKATMPDRSTVKPGDLAEIKFDGELVSSGTFAAT